MTLTLFHIQSYQTNQDSKPAILEILDNKFPSAKPGDEGFDWEQDHHSEREKFRLLAEEISKLEIPIEKVGNFLELAKELCIKVGVSKDEITPLNIHSVLKEIGSPEVLHYFRQIMSEKNLPGKQFSNTSHIPQEILKLYVRQFSGLEAQGSGVKRSVAEWDEVFAGLNRLHRSLANHNFSHDQTLYLRKQVGNVIFHSKSASCLEFLTELIETYKPNMKSGLEFIEVCPDYGSRHGLTPKTAAQFKSRLQPALEDPHNEDLKAIFKHMRSWAMPGQFGIADFTCHCYALEATPLNLLELKQLAKTIPGTSFFRFEQNRIDAISLNNIFPELRTLIHNQHPDSHRIVCAMLDFSIGKTADLTSFVKYSGFNLKAEVYLNQDNYKKVVEDKSYADKRVTVKEILKRLQQNTSLMQNEEIPIEDAGIKCAIECLRLAKQNSEFLKSPVSTTALKALNSLIEERMHNPTKGFTPNEIMGIAFVEHCLFERLNHMNYEEQCGIFKLPWFRQVLRFQELTASTDSSFEPKKFNNLCRRLNRSRDFQAAAKKLFEHAISRVYDAAIYFRAKDLSSLRDSLWSGSVDKCLISIQEPQDANTPIGKRHRDEQSLPNLLRLLGD